MAKEVKQPAEDPQLKKEVKDATKQAEHDARTGNVETVPQSEGGPVTDLPTGARSHPPQ
jgi:hypothetical protein